MAGRNDCKKTSAYELAMRSYPDPDVRKAFRGEGSVNDAFRLLIELRKVGGYK
jgi:hypothetical protein